jgi:hypothetical protein
MGSNDITADRRDRVSTIDWDVAAGRQRGPQPQGLPDWQPQPQVAGGAAGVRQPQLQDAPMQGLH